MSARVQVVPCDAEHLAAALDRRAALAARLGAEVAEAPDRAVVLGGIHQLRRLVEARLLQLWRLAR